MRDTEKTTKQVLIEARQIISKPENWTKYRRSSVTVGGIEVEPSSHLEKCFCAVGSIQKVKNYGTSEAYESKEVKKLDFALKKLLNYNNRVFMYNDHFETTHEDILKVFDMAIEAEK